jgi:hypothetical protein
LRELAALESEHQQLHRDQKTVFQQPLSRRLDLAASKSSLDESQLSRGYLQQMN